jgi:hypothetical protein
MFAPTKSIAAGLGLALLVAVPAARAQVPTLAAAPGPAAAPCAAWDKTPFDPNNPIVIEGFLVAHDTAALGVSAFSSSARKWTPVSGPTSSIVGSGDWCLLTREPGAMTAYSARLNSTAVLPMLGVAPIVISVSDDVILVVTVNPVGMTTAWGYSAVSGVWVPLPLGGPIAVADTTISRFVIGVREGPLYHGFSARTGAWTTFAGPGPGAPMTADGNTLLVDFFASGSAPFVSAFSGVRGCWAASPPLHPTNNTLVDHNIAYVRTGLGGAATFVPAAYSAYRAAWTVSGAARPLVAGIVEVVTDNVAYIEHPAVGLRSEAFGAGTGTSALLAGPFTLFNLDEDYAIVRDLGAPVAIGYSPLCGGFWAPEPLPAGVAVAPILGPDHIGGIDATVSAHVFLPDSNMWAAPLPKTAAATVIPEDSIIEISEAFVTNAIDTRYGIWHPTVPLPLPTTSGGSVIPHQTPGGIVHVFDERCDMWNAPYALAAPQVLAAGTNLVLAYPSPAVLGGMIEAYSVQRCDWTAPAAVLPLALVPVVEENVAAIVDSTGTLWAYGSANDGHTYYQWPNDTEYHVSGPHANPACAPTLVGYGVRSTPGNFSFVLVGPTLQCPPLVLPGFTGELWLPPALTSIFTTLGLHDPDCMLEMNVSLANQLTGCIMPWLQPLTLDAATFTFGFGCRRADPLYIFD